jgi:hypothetical protein
MQQVSHLNNGSTIAAEHTPYQEGYGAGLLFLFETIACPYPAGTEKEAEWMQGYDHGAMNHIHEHV